MGELTLRMNSDEKGAPFVLTMRYPPKGLGQKTHQNHRVYTLSLGDEEISKQLKRWEAVLRHLAQQGKNPRLIRLELGKKVVVKVER